MPTSAPMLTSQKPSAATATLTPPSALFQGYDTFRDCGRNTAIEGTSTQTGGMAVCSYTTCQTMSDVTQLLQIHGELSASAVFGSVEMKADYVQNLHLTENSLIIVIYANTIGATTSFTDTQLKAGLVLDNANEFYQAYGDQFVTSITMGAEFIATYSFYCQTRDEQKSLVTSLEANGVGVGGSVSASLTTAISKVSSEQNIRTNYKSTILGINSVPLPSPEQMIDFALSFSAQDPNPGVVIGFETQGYEHVPGMPDWFKPVVPVRQAFIGAPGLGGGFGADLETLINLNNQIGYIRQLYNVYGYKGDTELVARQQEIDTDQNALATVLNTIATVDVTVLPSIPSTPSLAYGVPQMAFSLSNAAYGYYPDQPNTNDVGIKDILLGSRIASVTVGGFANFSALLFFGGISAATYQYLDGTVKTVTRGAGTFGDYVEVNGATFEFQAGEFVTAISATQYLLNPPKVSWIGVQKRSLDGSQQTFGWPGPNAWSTPVETTTFSPGGPVLVGFSGGVTPGNGWITANFSPAIWNTTPSLRVERAKVATADSAAITGRAPTDAEWQTLSTWLPQLNRAKVRILGNPSTLYNCIAWSIGVANVWIQVPEPLYKFDDFYEEHGHDKAAVIGSSMAAIDGWATLNGTMTHASRKSPTNPGLFESKIGTAWRITHDRFSLVSPDYGTVVSSYLPVGPLADGETPKIKLVEPAAPLTTDELAAVRASADAPAPSLKSQFAQLLAAWREAIAKPPVAFSSNSADYARIPEAEALAALGSPALPLFLHTLAHDEDGFLLLPVIERITGRNDLVYRPDGLIESQQSRAIATVRMLMS